MIRNKRWNTPKVNLNFGQQFPKQHTNFNLDRNPKKINSLKKCVLNIYNI